MAKRTLGTKEGQSTRILTKKDGAGVGLSLTEADQGMQRTPKAEQGQSARSLIIVIGRAEWN